MSVFLFALALMTADTPAAESPPAAPPSIPAGAPSDDYGLVAWCYGALGGYLDLHDDVMPEVIRIESTWRKPGTRLEDDLKVYADLQKESRENLKLFARAIEAAEKASLRPISDRGAEAVRKGRSAWTVAATMSKARVAQEWMSWVLPSVCVTTAQRLETQAKLLGATFDPAEGAAPAEATSAESATDAPQAEAPAPDAPAAEAPSIDSLLSGATGTSAEGAETAPTP